MPTPALRQTVAAALLAALGAGAQTPPPPAAPGSAALQDLPRIGSARLRVWAWDVYDAHLLAPAGFDLRRFEEQRFGLELNYLRAFQGVDIAARSIDEMKGLAPIEPAQALRWQSAMAELFPNVRPGDRLTGVHLPGNGARFYFNGRAIGEIADDAFSRQFFGIWLSPRTSQPRLREALMQPIGGPPRAP
jgi:hypothetical protein